jgi:hypothetical protein
LNRFLEVIGKIVGLVAVGLKELWSHWTFWHQEIDSRSFKSALTVYFTLIGLPVLLFCLLALLSFTNPVEQPAALTHSEKAKLFESAKEITDYASPLLFALIGFFLVSVRLTIGFVGCVIRRNRFAK